MDLEYYLHSYLLLKSINIFNIRSLMKEGREIMRISKKN